jgi:hypothetical protein
MKNWVLRITCLIFIFSVFLSAENPHLLLHFDINKTLIASDKAGGKSVDNIINELLADKFSACWDPSIKEPITFDDYVRNVLVPGSKDDLSLREERKKWLAGFLDYLCDKEHPLYLPVLAEYTAAKTVLQNTDRMVFPSFYHLIEELDRKEISYSIILRSFGHEVFEVRDEIDRMCGGYFFDHSGEFKEGDLYVADAFTLSHHHIYHIMRHWGHLAIHDDWNYWVSEDMWGHYGKPFYVDLDDPSTLSIFFDDNIRLGNPRTNILSASHAKTGEFLLVDDLVSKGQAVRVDTMEAILDKDYFVDLVMKAMVLHSGPSPVECY